MNEQENKPAAKFLFTAVEPLLPGQKEGSIYFDFEQDFAEDDIRCIPMIVRFKLDACGIKLKLSEWSKMKIAEKNKLAEFNCATKEDVEQYRKFLQKLIRRHTGKAATTLVVENAPAWANTNEVPLLLHQKLDEFNWHISLTEWKALTNLQRFVLMKLCQPGHENKNFPKAAREFGLI